MTRSGPGQHPVGRRGPPRQPDRGDRHRGQAQRSEDEAERDLVAPCLGRGDVGGCRARPVEVADELGCHTGGRERPGRRVGGRRPQVGLELLGRFRGVRGAGRSRGSSLPWEAKKLSAGTTRVGWPVPAPGKAGSTPSTTMRTGTFRVSTVTAEPASRPRAPMSPTSRPGTRFETPSRRVAAATSASRAARAGSSGPPGGDRPVGRAPRGGLGEAQRVDDEQLHRLVARRHGRAGPPHHRLAGGQGRDPRDRHVLDAKGGAVLRLDGLHGRRGVQAPRRADPVHGVGADLHRHPVLHRLVEGGQRGEREDEHGEPGRRDGRRRLAPPVG